MEENTDGMASTDGVIIFLQISFECIWISSLDDFHTHMIQGLNGLVDRTMLLVIICVVEPVTIMQRSKASILNTLRLVAR